MKQMNYLYKNEYELYIKNKDSIMVWVWKENKVMNRWDKWGLKVELQNFFR